KRAYCLKTQPATGETYPKSDLFNKAIWHYQDGLRWSAAGINLLEWSPQPAVRRVMVLSAPGYTLLCCCFLSGLYTR
ncbi:hypothetical protein, partial [Escherichia coli]|uniref:hypothetical protein n=1 Tax=Escherichia coli TaxID=562 RepID=UPI001FF11BCC